MMVRAGDIGFPDSWYRPGPEAERVAAAISEGFCPVSTGGDPVQLDATGTCPYCWATWALNPDKSGYSGTWDTGTRGHRTTVTAYPFGSGWHGAQAMSYPDPAGGDIPLRQRPP